MRPAKPHRRQQLLRLAPGLGVVLAGNEERHHHVLQRGKLPKQVMELKHKAELLVPHSGQGLRGVVFV